MTPLSDDQYHLLRADAELIEADGHGEKVLRLADGTFLKLFRRKRLVSSALFYPYAKRFSDNTETLQKLGIACPTVIGLYRMATIHRDLVHYRPLQGRTLRQIDVPTEHSELRARFGAFVADLHNKGIYFRSLHLGNVILRDDGALGLIDIADLAAGGSALSKRRRLRNFRHIFRYPADREWIMGDGNIDFFISYALQSKPAIALNKLLKII